MGSTPAEVSAPGWRWLRLLAQVGLVVGLYYVLPVSEPLSPQRLWVRASATALLFVLVVWLLARQVLREVRADTADVRLDRLLLVVVISVMFFALIDFVVARAGNGQFIGLATKTDALYFALTTLTTVGYGDIHAEGQLARGVVCVHLLFNVVVLTSAIRTLSRGVADRIRSQRSDRDPPVPGQRPDDRDVQRDDH